MTHYLYVNWLKYPYQLLCPVSMLIKKYSLFCHDRQYSTLEVAWQLWAPPKRLDMEVYLFEQRSDVSNSQWLCYILHQQWQCLISLTTKCKTCTEHLCFYFLVIDVFPTVMFLMQVISLTYCRPGQVWGFNTLTFFNVSSVYLHKILRNHTAHACDGDTLEIRCPSKTTIAILSAFYGRRVPSQYLCPNTNQNITQEENTECMSPVAVQVLFPLVSTHKPAADSTNSNDHEIWFSISQL